MFRNKPLVNVTLPYNHCPICGQIVDQTGKEHPKLGVRCNSCIDSNRPSDFIGREHIDLKVIKHIRYIPIIGVYDYVFDFRGTRIMLNGRLSTVHYSANSSVGWEGDASWDWHFKGLAYDDLVRLYAERGGDITPVNPFPPCVAQKLPLASSPFLAITHVRDDDLRVKAIQVGEPYGKHLTRYPFIKSMFEPFANLFTRYRYGLMREPDAHGGSRGLDFWIMHGTTFDYFVGLASIRREEMSARLVGMPQDDLQLLSRTGNKLYQLAQERHGVVTQDATVDEVVNGWVAVMETLLRHNWSSYRAGTPEETHRIFCTMQGLLLNIMDEETLHDALEYSQYWKY